MTGFKDKFSRLNKDPVVGHFRSDTISYQYLVDLVSESVALPVRRGCVPDPFFSLPHTSGCLFGELPNMI